MFVSEREVRGNLEVVLNLASSWLTVAPLTFPAHRFAQFIGSRSRIQDNEFRAGTSFSF